MAKSKYRFPVTIGAHDPSADVLEVRDPQTGMIISHGTKGIKHLPPGTEVEMEAEQADRIFATFGTFEDWQARQRAPKPDASVKVIR